MGDDGGLDEPESGYEMRLRWGWGMAARTAVLAGVVTAVVLDPVDGHVTRGSVAYGCLLAAQSAFFLGQQYALYVRGCLLRIDAAGLTVIGEPTVPWRELRKAEVRRGALVFFPWSPETALPMLPVGLKSPAMDARRRRRRLARRFGSPMVVFTRLYGVRRAEVIAAVRRYSANVPVFE
ncbi:hypothetical protein [Streptomyces sp. H39-S7]|uniref:hypothetical protein n=1 Tax=Streptomyces sp. H39-S7 TaxID=3004357 RepID=UPI0022AFBCB7|nr:hypothetical protein [Streptomyces sp. H39-S7]MCZ4126183.1 hypothetical protein [Streptomyces sp. H39-S7]